MRYRDLARDRFRLPPSHPILLRLHLDPAQWYDFERLQSDNPAVRILGHDEPAAGRMIVHLACASRETRDRLKDGWC
jgi:hypothetical protein